MRHVLKFIKNKRQDRKRSPPLSFSSKMLSVSLGFEEVEEVGEEDSSKDIILEMYYNKIGSKEKKLMEKIENIRTCGLNSKKEIVTVGTNAKIHEVTACIGLTNLDIVDKSMAQALININVSTKTTQSQ